MAKAGCGTVNGKEGKPWKQGPLAWGCNISSWFSQGKCLAYDRQFSLVPLPAVPRLLPSLVGCAQQRQTCCNVSSSPAETMVLLLEGKKKKLA